MFLLRTHTTGLLTSLIILAAFWAIDTAAQNIPSFMAPGRFEQQIGPLPVVPRGPTPDVISNLRDLTEIPREGADSINFQLHRIEIEGVTIYELADLSAYYGNIIGREVTLADIFVVADAITARYESDGFLLGRAVVPFQELDDGILTIHVIEGYIDRILLTGQLLGRDERFREFSEKIIGSRPLHASVLQRYLRLAGDLAGVSINSVLQPSQSTEDAAELILEIVQKPVDVVLRVGNRGTRVQGPMQLFANIGFNGIVSKYGRSEVALATSQFLAEEGRLRFISVRHEETINAEGTVVTAALSGSRMRPGEEFRSLDPAMEGEEPIPVDTRIENDMASIEVSHPIKRSGNLNIYVVGGLYAQNADVEQMDVSLVNDDLRVLRAAVVSYLNDRYGGQSAGALRISQGLNFLGASVQEIDQPEASAGFTKITVEASRAQKLTDFAKLFIQAGAQWTGDDLPITEEFVAGGRAFGRAYDFGEVSGDRGAGMSVELQISPKLKIPMIHRYEIYGFYDIAKLWNENDLPAGRVESAGGGLRFAVTETLTADLTLAKPLAGPVTSKGDDDWRIFFDISMHTENRLRPPARF